MYHINRMKEKNTIISVDAEKSLDKIQHIFMIKSKLGIVGNYHDIIKIIYEPHTQLSSYSVVKDWKLLRSGTRHGCPLCHLYST